VLGIAGVMVTWANMWDAFADRNALIRSGRNGDLRFMAGNAIQVEVIRLVKMLAVVVIGIISLSAQPVLTAAQRRQLHIPTWTTTSIAITAGLGVIVVGTIFQAVLDRYVRHRFYGRK
jgi:hypothetical protein